MYSCCIKWVCVNYGGNGGYSSNGVDKSVNIGGNGAKLVNNGGNLGGGNQPNLQILLSYIRNLQTCLSSFSSVIYTYLYQIVYLGTHVSILISTWKLNMIASEIRCTDHGLFGILGPDVRKVAEQDISPEAGHVTPLLQPMAAQDAAGLEPT